MATKTSILVFYLTLTKETEEKVFRAATWVTLAVVNIAGLALTFLNIFQCHNPVSASWQNPTPPKAHCTDIVTLYLSSAPVNIITDLAIFFLPMPILTGMRLPLKQKIILVITFSFGFFVAVVDVIRIAELQTAAVSRLKLVGQKGGTGTRIVESTDFSWYASLSFMWSAVEVNVGIICACVPSLKPLVSRLLPSMLRSHGENEYSGSSLEHAADLNLAIAERLPSHVNGSGSPTSPQAHQREVDNGANHQEMGMMDFLTTPDMEHIARTETVATAATAGTTQSTPQTTFFDFVNVKKPKSMVKMSNRESLFPIAVVTILFFLWGFAYGLLDILNSQFEKIVGLSYAQSVGLHAAYFGAYFVAPLTFGQYVLKRWGFKATFITGLCIYGCGTLIFWPSAVLASYPAFIISNFIVGLGLSTLEIAANPFTSLCGPLEYAEIRLNISQGVQAIGSVVSPLLAQKVLFKSILNAPSLINVQWTYLAIALFDVLLAVAFYYFPIPEASDKDLQRLADKRRSINEATLGPYPIIWVTLSLGVLSQFCYVGGQEALNVNYISYISTVLTHSSIEPFYYQAIGHSLFAIGRFLTAGLNYIFTPRWVLAFLYTGLIITSALSMGLTGEGAAASSLLLYTFEAGAFSIIYAICLRGMGAHTKTAAAIMTASTGGGAIVPLLQIPAQRGHRSLRYSFCVIVAVFAFGSIFPAYLNTVPAAQHQVDPHVSQELIAAVDAEHMAREQQERKERPGSQSSSTVSILKSRLSLVFSGKKKEKRASSESSVPPDSEHDDGAERKAEGGKAGSGGGGGNGNWEEQGRTLESQLRDYAPG